ncbi:MAG: 50S ribosomal protein L21 [Planctomycetota bacterium]
MYAVISDRNRQYRATPGAKLELDLVEAQPGAVLELPVLLIADGAAVKVGAPFVAGATAKVKVLSHQLGDKIIIGKYKHRKHMTNRRRGFRAQLTMVEVVSISG